MVYGSPPCNGASVWSGCSTITTAYPPDECRFCFWTIRRPLDLSAGGFDAAIGGDFELQPVLIVDDDPLIQLRLEALLESAGYSVTCVSSASEALAAGQLSSSQSSSSTERSGM